MPRLLLLITDLELGGTPVVVRELAIRLSSPTAHVEVACLKPAGVVGDQLRAAGITVTSFDARRAVDLRRTTGALVRLVREHRIDTVFSFLIHANFIAARAARKLADVRFIQSIQTTQPKPRWHWWLQRRIHRSAARVVVPSESVALRAMERSNVPRAKLVVIPNAVDADPPVPSSVHGGGLGRGAAELQASPAPPSFSPLVSPTPQPPPASGKGSGFRVGFVGRLDPIKRIPDLIDAIALLPSEYTLHLFGEGAERASIEGRIVGPLQQRVILYGRVDDPRAAYAAIDLLVLPSDAEGFGLVIIEAMAAGVPVIGTDVDGIHDVITHEQTGLLVPPRDPATLAAAIRRIATDRGLRDRLINTARAEVARRFGWPAVLTAYREVLQIPADDTAT